MLCNEMDYFMCLEPTKCNVKFIACKVADAQGYVVNIVKDLLQDEVGLHDSICHSFDLSL